MKRDANRCRRTRSKLGCASRRRCARAAARTVGPGGTQLSGCISPVPWSPSPAAWLLRTAQAWLVLDLTGTPAALAVVTLAQALPVTILTLFAGVLIDRTQSRKLLLLVQLVFSVQTAIMAMLVLSQQIQFWHVVVLAVVLGVASAIDFPTRSSIVSELVEPGLVPNGIALNSALNSAARIIGPGVGGLMIAVWGSGVCFAVTAVIYVRPPWDWCACAVGISSQAIGRRAPILSQLAEGLRYSFSTPMLAVNMLLAGFYGTFAYNWALVLPLLARFALNSGAEGFGRSTWPWGSARAWVRSCWRPGCGRRYACC